MSEWRCPELWPDGKCWIIAGGPSVPREFGVPGNIIQMVMSGAAHPSAYSQYLAPLHDKHVIGVNNAYQIGAWIDALFFGDCAWYLVHRQRLLEWPGLKVTCCSRFAKTAEGKRDGVKYLGKNSHHRFGISPSPAFVSWNSNSGAAAISLAAHLGATTIVLLGFDMSLDTGKASHWHGSHGSERKIPPFARHLQGFPAIAKDAVERGITILNASPNSAITAFPKMPAKDLL